MNQNTLETFLAILETGSLAKASKRLYVGQSTVTTRLKRLEDELGQILFNRTKSGVTLTSSGHKFRRYAETMTDL
ncbi:MAG: DNA-binding transcriptional LysR family regulator [Parasphingorhabdus sp.]